MRGVHVFHVTYLVLGLFWLSPTASMGQCVRFELSDEEEAFLTRAKAVQANAAVWNDSDQGRMHCYFGLDTIVWREGRLDSLHWGMDLNVNNASSAQACGVYQGATTWLYRGQLQLLGRATEFSSGLDLLSCSPALGWERQTFSGKSPSLRAPFRSARMDNNSMLFFGEDGGLSALDLSTQSWIELGVLTQKFVEYLGEFSVIDLADFIMVFGDLGGGLIQKSTMKFVTNYELKRELLTSVQFWCASQNQLLIGSAGAQAADRELLFDAESMFVGGGSMAFMKPVDPVPEEREDWMLSDFVGVLLGLVVGALIAGVYFSGRRPVSRPVDSGILPETAAVVQNSEESAFQTGRDNPNAIAEEADASKLPGARTSTGSSEVEIQAHGQLSTSRSAERVMSSKSKRRLSMEALTENLLAKGGSFTSTELNQILGIELDASEDSQRARRARLVKQINELHETKTGEKLIVRERDPNDRRQIRYRINR